MQNGGGTGRRPAAEVRFDLGVGSNVDALHRRSTGLARRRARGVFPNDERHDEVVPGRHVAESEYSALVAGALDQRIVILGHVRGELRRILLQQYLPMLVVAISPDDS